MHSQLQRKKFGFALLGALAMAMAGGLYVNRQQRLAKFYGVFQQAIDRAVGHYEGSIATTAAFIRAQPDTNYSTVTFALKRPPVVVPNQGELYCDVVASIAMDIDVSRLHFAISGPRDLVAYLYRRLMTETDLAMEVTSSPSATNNDGVVNIAVIVFDDTDRNLTAVAAKLGV